MSIVVIDDSEDVVSNEKLIDEATNDIPYEPIELINDIQSNDSVEIKPTKNIIKIDIKEFDDAIVDGKFILNVNDYLVIEHHSNSITKEKDYWLHTSLYSIVKIFDNGDIRLWNEQLEHFAYTNYKTAQLNGDILKIPSKKFLRSNLKKKE